MEKKETIRELREELHELQKVCPHLDRELNFELEKGNCPYCGGKILND
jgi:DNA-directed RNA polymerase subunit RPC12/RpoP